MFVWVCASVFVQFLSLPLMTDWPSFLSHPLSVGRALTCHNIRRIHTSVVAGMGSYLWDYSSPPPILDSSAQIPLLSNSSWFQYVSSWCFLRCSFQGPLCICLFGLAFILFLSHNFTLSFWDHVGMIMTSLGAPESTHGHTPLSLPCPNSPIGETNLK